jgi:signal transduction histidine kinase
MSVGRRLPIRLRLTLVFTVATVTVLATTSGIVYERMSAQLLDATDAALAAQADALEEAFAAAGTVLDQGRGGPSLSDDQFAQIVSPSGQVLQFTSSIGDVAVIDPATLRSVTGRTYLERRVPALDDVARILVEPMSAPGRPVLVLGASLGDEADALSQLVLLLAGADSLALALTAVAFWLLAGALLRPVDRMRMEADAISAVEPSRRLSLPRREDELTRLGRTLNAMLDRIERSFERERRFVDDASHELRTPLAVVKAELDLALRRRRSPNELRASIRRAAAETDRVVRLAHDLLVLARAHDGRMPVARRPTPLRLLLVRTRARHLAVARGAGVQVEVDAPPIRALVDPERVRQALDNLLDNALRHTPRGGRVRLAAWREGGTVRISVADTGPGFAADLAGRVLEPFAGGPGAGGRAGEGAGLGLAIVRAIALGHGGSVTAGNGPRGGAVVTLTLSER